MIDLVEICIKVLARLSKMDFEKKCRYSSEQLIFPQKVQAKGTKIIDRLSEQELRLLFIEEFKKSNKDLFYSIETPTVGKYSFGNDYEDIKTNPEGQSASLDMCAFQRDSNTYKRLLNIEFKHKNIPLKNIGKDILKLIHESQNGAYIHLLNNTDSGTFRNKNETGVFDKLYKSFKDFGENWQNESKFIQLVIMSLEEEEKIFIHRIIRKSDLDNLKEIFFIDSNCGNITEVKGNGWKTEKLN